jgi:enoyl-CoA hydratase/carnithine racemase
MGATMTLSIDARIASPNARFGLVFGKIGIVTEACASWFLPRLVGPAQALEWTYCADIFDAQKALRGGLVRSVVPPEKLLDEVVQLAQRFVRNKSPASIALMRQMMLRDSATDPETANKIESLAMSTPVLTTARKGLPRFWRSAILSTRGSPVQGCRRSILVGDRW